MKIGQTSAINFVSHTLTSAIGFFATLYFARVVGSEVLGIYFLLQSGVAWVTILVDAGLSKAIAKRMSEGQEPGMYFQLGLLLVGASTAVLVFVLLALSRPITNYIQHPLATFLLIVLVVSSLANTIVRSGLSGSHNVHVSGILNSIQSVLQAGLQVGAATLGLGLAGLVYGWAVAVLLIAAAGVVYLMNDLQAFPTTRLDNIRRRLASLYAFAKYAWLGSIKGKTNNHADILILGLFVPNDLIGVYSICWNIASFLTIFGSSINATLFPEISRLDQQDDNDEIADLLAKSIQYTGLFVIPGLFGGFLLASEILRIYGSDFTVGTEVLFLLIVSVWAYDYQKQLTNVLAGMNRPDLDFRVNGTFIGSNIVLNLLLIPLIGWVGAAVATVLSSLLSMIYAYYTVDQIVRINLPYQEIGKQFLAAVLMSAVVLTLKHIDIRYSILNSNFTTVMSLIFIGAITYVTFLIFVSEDTRRTVVRNLDI